MDRIDYHYFGEKGDEFFWFVAKSELIIKIIEKEGTFDRVLNLGCGVGNEVKKFREFGNTVATDIDLYSVNHVKKYVQAVRSDASNISFKSNTFDCVIISDVLEHIENDSHSIDEIIRVTKTGGLIVITVPAIKFLFSTHDLALGHYRRYSRKGLLDLCKGLQIVRMSYWNFISFPIITPFRIIKKFLNVPSRPDPLKVPEIINKILLFLLRMENEIITRGNSLPIGLSFIVVCRKGE